MAVTTVGTGRRERNKQEKLARITEAASTLFAERGVDEVTTQEIADAADIGTGTLFLYAKTKGELLLLVQNASYREALDRGTREAAKAQSLADAVMAVLTPIVLCNRSQIENGRTYLREMLFGDPEEQHHRDALKIVGETEQVVAGFFERFDGTSPEISTRLARAISSIMFTTMGSGLNASLAAGDVVHEVADQLAAVLLPIGDR
ncbi:MULTISPECIES: TetR/AcrR family transcriptional regulator [unclassified Frondihabitans]|uniref:TetR/AcrR family transcriptional regulator n=1 Tax=unclassified Frondihabitans TaxID=2626248 RepID=UPI000F4E9531|nr:MULTISPECIES: TetR/AcrR family transcriptional regulator [unclassified Frondihabitans]RPE77838.1 TetR family transcriptional regulator [Frondihabitans sp. PhB153]RPF08117.1 TetR family transcriptional regulator [Frondihabitans sp. PhB161]